ncbi:hypothetical protein BHM03_00052393, partial [Ensete ventricosum]
RVRPPLALPLLHAATSACDRRWHARLPLARLPPRATASGMRGCHLRGLCCTRLPPRAAVA